MLSIVQWFLLAQLQLASLHRELVSSDCFQQEVEAGRVGALLRSPHQPHSSLGAAFVLKISFWVFGWESQITHPGI